MKFNFSKFLERIEKIEPYLYLFFLIFISYRWILQTLPFLDIDIYDELRTIRLIKGLVAEYNWTIDYFLLYAPWYKFLSIFFPNPIDLYYANMWIILLSLTILFYLLLLKISNNPFSSFLAVLFFIFAPEVNLFRKKQIYFATIIVLIHHLIATYAPKKNEYPILLVGYILGSFAHPQFSFGAVLILLFYIHEHRFKKKELGKISIIIFAVICKCYLTRHIATSSFLGYNDFRTGVDPSDDAASKVLISNYKYRNTESVTTLIISNYKEIITHVIYNSRHLPQDAWQMLTSGIKVIGPILFLFSLLFYFLHFLITKNFSQFTSLNLKNVRIPLPYRIALLATTGQALISCLFFFSKRISMFPLYVFFSGTFAFFVEDKNVIRRINFIFILFPFLVTLMNSHYMQRKIIATLPSKYLSSPTLIYSMAFDILSHHPMQIPFNILEKTEYLHFFFQNAQGTSLPCPLTPTLTEHCRKIIGQFIQSDHWNVIVNPDDFNAVVSTPPSWNDPSLWYPLTQRNPNTQRKIKILVKRKLLIKKISS